MPTKIFVNYRRDDDPIGAARVRDGLVAKFGSTNVYMAANHWVAGPNFDIELDKVLSDCGVFIAIIGEHWVDLLGAKAARQPDYVRAEIAAALKRKIAVIPVRIGYEGQLPPLPPLEELPPDIRDFLNYQQHSVAHEHYDRDIATLVQTVEAVTRKLQLTGRETPIALAPTTVAASVAVVPAAPAPSPVAPAAPVAPMPTVQPAPAPAAPPIAPGLPPAVAAAVSALAAATSPPTHSLETLLKLRRAALETGHGEAAGDVLSSQLRRSEDETGLLREKVAKNEQEAAQYRALLEARDVEQARLRLQNEELAHRQHEIERMHHAEREKLSSENRELARRQHEIERMHHVERDKLSSENQELARRQHEIERMHHVERDKLGSQNQELARRQYEIEQIYEKLSPSRSRGKRLFLGISSVVGAVAVGGLAYVFRDRFADASRFLIDNAERLLSLLGLSKGASLPLLGIAQTPPAQPDIVDCSVFAPPVVRGESRFMVQVFLHLVEQTERVEFLATAMDDSSKLRGRQTLQVPITRDTPVRIVLEGQGIEVAEPVQELLWRGEPNVASFSCRLREGISSDVLHPIARLYVDEKPVGRIMFQIRREAPNRARDPLPMPELTGSSARTYKFAFLSYASEDRAEVLKRAQALEAANIGFFQDVLSLNPGERYERKIYRKIDEADLFILFWSRSARVSKWVNSEIEYARTCQRMHPEALPDIVPIVLDDPRDAPPPELLSDQHFNGMIATMISYEGQRPKRDSGFLSRWFGLSS